jgi:hypothetical protein
MADIRSLVSQIPMEPGYVPAPSQPDLTTIQRLLSIPQVARAVGQNLAVGAASLPYGIYKGFGDPAAGEAAMSQFQQEYGYTPTNPAAQRQLQGLGEFLQQLETEYKIPPIMAPVAATPALGIRGLTPQTERLARDLVRDIQTTPPTGAVTLAPSSVPKSDIGFYSQLEAAVQPLQNKGTGQQYLAQIQKSAGVKPEEIQWTGLDTFLQGKQSVTKQEIQDYLNANRVDVQEVRLGQNNAYTEWGKRLAQAKDSQEAAKINMELTLPDLSPVNYYNLRDMWAGPAARGDQEALSKIRSLGLTPEQEANVLDYGRQVSLVSELKGSAPPNLNPKFSNYTLPGGENYREILLTLPQKQIEFSTQGWYAKPQGSYAWLVFDERGNQIGTAYDAKNVQDAVQEVAKMQGATPIDKNFRSGHFDQPNILAHLRVNDRTVDGKKTLFVEEIQSDWHQAGRKRGYKGQTRSVEQIDKELDSVVNELRSMPGVAYAPSAEDWARYPEITARHDALVAERASAGSSRDFVPDAPFKTSWHELSLKRAIQEAAEKGYDQIAFTTGKTQAERYDLSNRIKTIVYSEPDANGRRTVTAITPDGDRILGDRYTMSEIEDNVGKEMAEKMEKSAGEFDARTGTYALSGLDLKTEHKGMKGFYDNILPKSLDKLGKKFGAKVGKTEMDGVEVWQMDITPQMRESVTTKGQPLFAIPAIGAGLLGAGMMQEEPIY